jgi:signal transduction histidine kinase
VRATDDLERLAEEQAALRRVATLVARGASESQLAAAVTRELAGLFGAQRASTLRWDGDTIRIIGDWNAEGGELSQGRVMPFGGDTITARVVESGAPARLNSADDLQTEFARKRWSELGLHASIAAPIFVDGKIWGVVGVARTQPDDVFPPDAEYRLADFAALVAQSIVNAEARRETAELVAEQTALRRIATLVAGGKPQAEVLGEVTSAVGRLFDAATVHVVQWESAHDEVGILASWCDGRPSPVRVGTRYRPAPGGATLTVLETGIATRSEDHEPVGGTCAVIAAPVIVQRELLAALTAARPVDRPFPAGAETRLRSFADLAAQAITHDRVQAELIASRARIVRASDDSRERLERNLHDGAQQRLVSVSIVLRLATSKLDDSPAAARNLLVTASEEVEHALEELRDLARGLHPAILRKHGLGPALEALARRAPLPVGIVNELEERMPMPVEAAVYYVVAESLTNVAKYASATQATIRARRTNGVVRIEVIDDGVGGADVGSGSGLRGLADRIEALGGRFGIDSAPGEGTRVWAEVKPGAE